MGKVILNDTTLTGIADAIRKKNGETNTYLPSEMPAKIEAIETGGSSDMPISTKYTRNNTFPEVECDPDVYFENWESDTSKYRLNLDYFLHNLKFTGEKTKYEVVCDLLQHKIKPCSLKGAFYNDNYFSGTLDFSNIDFSDVSSMEYFMYQTMYINKIIFPENIDTKNLLDISYFLSGCNSIEGVLDLSNFNFTNVYRMNYAFENDAKLTSIIFPENKMPKMLLDAEAMFYNCNKLTEVDLKNIKLNNLVSAKNMFCQCSSIEELDFTGKSLDECVEVTGMFKNCNGLKKLVLPNMPKVYSPDIFSSSFSLKLTDLTFSQDCTFSNSIANQGQTLPLTRIWKNSADTLDDDGITYGQRYENFANSIGENTSGATRNIKLYTTLYNSLTDEQKALLIDKGYTITYGKS